MFKCDSTIDFISDFKEPQWEGANFCFINIFFPRLVRFWIVLWPCDVLVTDMPGQYEVATSALL